MLLVCLGVCWSDGGQDGEVLVHERGQQQGVGRPQVRTSTEKRSSVKTVIPACTAVQKLYSVFYNTLYSRCPCDCTFRCREKWHLPSFPWDTASTTSLLQHGQNSLPVPILTSNLNFSLDFKMKDGWVSWRSWYMTENSATSYHKTVLALTNASINKCII